MAPRGIVGNAGVLEVGVFFLILKLLFFKKLNGNNIGEKKLLTNCHHTVHFKT